MFNLFRKKKKEFKEEGIKQEVIDLILDLKKNRSNIYNPNDLNGFEAYETLRNKTKTEVKEAVLALNELILDWSLKIEARRKKDKYRWHTNDISTFGPGYAYNIQAGLIRKKLDYTDKEWITLFKSYKKNNDEFKISEEFYSSFTNYPVNYAIKQIEYFLKKNELTEELKSFIVEMLSWPEFKVDGDRSYYGANMNKAVQKLRAIISDVEEGQKLFQLPTKDIGNEVNQVLSAIKENETEYSQVFELVSTVSGSKPTKRFINTVAKLQESIRPDKYRKIAQELLQIPLNRAFVEETTTHEHAGRSYEYTHTSYLCNPSQTFIKGLVWTMERYSDKETIRLLSKLTEKSYSKIPGQGPAAASIGNACVMVLGNMRGKDGLGALSTLKLKLRQNNIKKIIDKHLNAGAKKYNVSVEELKEMAIPDFKLVNGKKIIAFDEYNLQVWIEASKVKKQFFKADGQPMKSTPSAVKNNALHSSKLKKIQKEIKEIQKVYSAQKQRIDNQFILNRTWDMASFKKFYINHGLVNPIASKLIWSFKKKGQKCEAIMLDGNWYTVAHDKIDWIDEETEVSLWHPVNATEAEIIHWRQKVIDLQWKQPVKQAFREIYILTDAEVNTRTYSNRMAAHILKQHQFNALATLRDWKFSLMGWYDDGRESETAIKQIPEYGISAEYWIDELNNDEDDFNEAGIWYHIATDQVKFKNSEGEVMNLEDVPKMVFTEIMRDVDMFVGVCSVGNDPQWMDNNGARQANRDYWTSYSFGDLNEIAKTRKSILENLLPRLKKIRDKAKIDGKFLIVRGKLRTYKIHIGSGNILMEPNDQYLCIVPARSSESSTEKLFIPFEGDKGLSIVLSKAILLADDDKITDSTIVNQINR
ncbi:MAG: DUF4132 domain-containing protein [Bacteroidia bacterium]